MSGSTATTRPEAESPGARTTDESPEEEENPLFRLLDHGQSYWLDNLTRAMIESGELEARVAREGLRGMTSNPATFSKAIAGGSEYDEQLEELARAGLPASEIYERLTVTDIRNACDILRPVYDGSDGVDGYVSLEVSPYLAHDTGGTIREATHLFERVDRPNVFIKIPGTPAGVPAIEECLVRGVNVNVTLLFSIDAYEAVADAYISALERRLENGDRIDRVASVASFFLSRIDVLVDRILGHRIRPGAEVDGVRPGSVAGRAAVANAKLAYESFERIIRGDRWKALEEEGAMVQRMLWASTSTKDPLYSDVRYVEPLIGPDTINTMPERTIEAFRDHGRVADTVRDGVDDARETMAALDEVGVDFDAVTRELLNEGVQKFIDPFDTLLGVLEERRRKLGGHGEEPTAFRLGDLDADVAGALDSLTRRQAGRLIDAGSPWLWTDDADVAATIRNRLGWLRSPGQFSGRIEELRAFASEIAPPDFEDVVHLGMGGSSLAADVAERIFGPGEGRPRLTVLDSTDPAAIAAVEEAVDPARTLFLVASKSGTTTETLALYRRFREVTEEAVGTGGAGDRFVAITDPGTPLADEARDRGFRRIFENPEDIGGRYSALSYFGLVPMALLGVDIGGLVERAREMRRRADGAIPAASNPGVRLGATLGYLGREGRDKVTVLASPGLAPFGDWIEQLLAESTGKDGAGLVPVVGEPAATPDAYADDRIFVHLRLAGTGDDETARAASALAESGHPVVSIDLPDREALGGEFVRWELATAIAGAVLGVNPFDEPNVGESKRNTREALAELEGVGELREGDPVASDEGLAVYAEEDAGWLDGASLAGASPEDVVRALAGSVVEGRDYVAILAYLPPGPAVDRALQALRKRLRDRLGAPVTVGYGPRYLHSTGQLHKGGPDRGAYLILTADPRRELPVPGEAWGFADLERAQALGDYRSLAGRGRRVIRIHLGGDVEAALGRLEGLLAR